MDFKRIGKFCSILFSVVLFCSLFTSCPSPTQSTYTVTYKYKDSSSGEWTAVTETYLMCGIHLMGAPQCSSSTEIFKGWADDSETIYKGYDAYTLTEKETVFTAVYSEIVRFKRYYPRITQGVMDSVISSDDIEKNTVFNFSNYYDDDCQQYHDSSLTITGFTVISLSGVQQFGVDDTYTITESACIVPNVEGYKFSYWLPSLEGAFTSFDHRYAMIGINADWSESQSKFKTVSIIPKTGVNWMNFWTVYKKVSETAWDVCHEIGFDEAFTTIREQYLSSTDSVVLIPTSGKTFERSQTVTFYGAYTEKFRNTDEICEIWSGNTENNYEIKIPMSNPVVTFPSQQDAWKKNSDLASYQDVYITSDLTGNLYFGHYQDPPTFFDEYEFVGWQEGAESQCTPHTKEEFQNLHGEDLNWSAYKYPYVDDSKRIYMPGESITVDGSTAFYGVWKKKTANE